MTTHKIIIKDAIDSTLAVSSDKGNIIFLELSKNIDAQECSVLDFSGLKSMTTAFLNTAIGELYKTKSKTQLNTYIKIDPNSMTELQKNKVTLVMNNSRKKYSETFNNKINEVSLYGDSN